MKKVWKKATVLLLCVTILTTSVVYNYQTEDKNAKTANHVAKNEEKDEKENKGQKSKWKSKTKSNDEVKLLNANVSYNADSDGDGMTDAFETLNNMNPNVADADGNGIPDGKDIHTITYTSQDEMTEDEAYLPSVEMTATGEQLQTLAIGAVDDNPLLCDKIPGYIGHAYNFTMDGEFEQATLKFEVDDSVDMKKEPTVYYYNEETQELEELKTNVNGHMVSAVTTHFSKYILVYKQDYNNFENVDPDGKDYLDMLINNNIVLGVNMYVSPSISFEIRSKRKTPKYGDITTKYDTSYLDSIESFFENYKNEEWKGSMLCSYNGLKGMFKRGIPNNEETEFIKGTISTDGLLGGNYLWGKYSSVRVNKDGWNIAMYQVRNGATDEIRDIRDVYKIDTEKNEQIKFDDMDLMSITNESIMADGFSRLKKCERENCPQDIPICNSIVYVIGEVHDAATSLPKIFRQGQINNMSVYIINLGSGITKDDEYKNTIQKFLDNQKKEKENNPDMNEINVRYYYAKTNDEFKNEVLNGELVPNILEDYELVDTDHDGLSDMHEYMISEGKVKTGTNIPLHEVLNLDKDEKVENEFVYTNEIFEDYYNKDNANYTGKVLNWRNSKDTDGDGINDGDEIEIKKTKLKKTKDGYEYKAIIHSDPTRKDSDGDGIEDGDEYGEEFKNFVVNNSDDKSMKYSKMITNPMRYDITDLTLGYAALFVNLHYTLYLENVRIRNLKLDDLKGKPYEALKDFIVVGFNSSGEREYQNIKDSDFDFGLGMCLIKKKIDGKENCIVCCRGTDDDWTDIYTEFTVGLGFHEEQSDGNRRIDGGYTQLDKAKAEIKKWSSDKNLQGAEWFITGHKLGGRIAQDLYVSEGNKFKAGATFDGMGYLTKDLEQMSEENIEYLFKSFQLFKHLNRAINEFRSIDMENYKEFTSVCLLAYEGLYGYDDPYAALKVLDSIWGEQIKRYWTSQNDIYDGMAGGMFGYFATAVCAAIPGPGWVVAGIAGVGSAVLMHLYRKYTLDASKYSDIRFDTFSANNSSAWKKVKKSVNGFRSYVYVDDSDSKERYEANWGNIGETIISCASTDSCGIDGIYITKEEIANRKMYKSIYHNINDIVLAEGEGSLSKMVKNKGKDAVLNKE